MCRWLRSTGSSFTARRRFSPQIVEEPDQIEIMKDEIRTMKKIIKDGIIVTMNAAGDVWDHGYVMFEDTKILAAGPEDELEKTLQELTAQGILKAGETFEEIDAKRAIVIPGLVNTHCHLGMIPFRGLGDAARTACGCSCFRWRTRLWTRRWQSFPRDMPSVSCCFPA